MLTRDMVLDLLRKNYHNLAAEYGVKRIGLFGSCAKGELNELSDIDLVVEFEQPIGLKFVDFLEHLERLLGRRVDVLTPAGVQSIRIPRIAQEIAQSIVYV